LIGILLENQLRKKKEKEKVEIHGFLNDTRD